MRASHIQRPIWASPDTGLGAVGLSQRVRKEVPQSGTRVCSPLAAGPPDMPTEAGVAVWEAWVQGEGTPTPAQASEHLKGKCAGLPREQEKRDFPSTGD